MKSSGAALLLLALPAFSAQTRSLGGQDSPAAVPAGSPKALPPGPTSLPPILIGNLAETENPVRAALEARAEGLQALGQGAGLTPAQAAAHLGPLAAPAAHPTDRLAARVLARAAVSREERRALLELHPVLAGGAVERLEGLVQPDSAYRGTLEAPSSPLFQLAEAYRDDPAVRHLFYGGRGEEDLALEGLAHEGDSLYLGGRKLKPLEREAPVYAHPRLPEVVLRLKGADDRARAYLADREETEALARAGAGPRFLGRGAIPHRSGSAPEREVTLKERVFGPSLWDLIGDARYGHEAHAAVQDLLERLADGGLEPEVMEKANILVGETAADPRLRAFLVQPGGFRPRRGGETAEDLRGRMLARDTFDRMDIIVGGDAPMPDAIYKPFGEIMREGLYWGTKDPFWRSWGRAVKGLFVRPKP